MSRSGQSEYYAYPEAREGPKTPYANTPKSNPVIRGIPLLAGALLASNSNLVAGFLWSNAGFTSLRSIKALDEYDARYDPTVIPLSSNSKVESNTKGLSSFLVESTDQTQSPYRSVKDYNEAYKNNQLTPSSVAEALLKLISESPEHRLAFLVLRKQEVLAEAEASTRRYKAGNPLSVLDGIPVAVKDEVDLDGCEKSLGTSRDYTRAEGGTSWCVEKWQEAGALVVGKLNMHELGLDTTNNNPTKGTPRNPHNPNYYTGGSSGGSAYAVSTGLVPITLGADGGGSIRIPASFCGVYGLKPTHGRVSDSPTLSLSTTCGVIGPLASSISDLEIAYRIMATPNPSVPASSLFAIPGSIPISSHPKVLGIYTPWFDRAEPPVLNACNTALTHYRSAGYKTIPISIPYLPDGQLAHAITILSEISAGIHSLSGLTPANKILLSVARQTPASDFLLAQKMRNLLMQHLAFLFKQHPGMVIVTPTVPIAGWHISGGDADLKYGVSDANMSVRVMEYVWLANFTGCPALSIPVGRVDPKEGDGKVPVSLMGMGEWGSEDALLEWGRVGEKWTTRENTFTKPKNWVDILEVAGT